MSLVEALSQALAYGYVGSGYGYLNPGPNTIKFDIQEALPAEEFWKLTARGPYPDPRVITAYNYLTIDGYSQPGSSPNTLSSGGNNAKILIELADGVSFPDYFSDRDSVVKGVSTPFVNVYSPENTLAGCFIGVDPEGQPLGNAGAGVSIGQTGLGANNNCIGGTAPAAFNVIASNTGFGVDVVEGTGNKILGNEIFGNGGGISSSNPLAPNQPERSTAHTKCPGRWERRRRQYTLNSSPILRKIRGATMKAKSWFTRCPTWPDRWRGRFHRDSA